MGKTKDLLKSYYDYDGTDDAKCKLCNPPKPLKRTGGNTRSLTTHLEAVHPEAYKQFTDKKRKAEGSAYVRFSL